MLRLCFALFLSCYCRFSIVQSHLNPLGPRSIRSRMVVFCTTKCLFETNAALKWANKWNKVLKHSASFATLSKTLMTWRHSLASRWPAVCWRSIFSTTPLTWLLCHVGPKYRAGNRLYHPMKDTETMQSWPKQGWVKPMEKDHLSLVVNSYQIKLSLILSVRHFYINVLHISTWALKNCS